MSEDKQKKNVPELRFPEFSGEWEERKLGSVVEVNPKCSSDFPEEFKYIDLESVKHGKVNGYSKYNKKNAPSRAQRVPEIGDVFFQTVRPYQKNNFIFTDFKGDFIVSTGYAQLRSPVDSNYLYNLLLTDSFVNKVLVKCTGTNYPAINSTDLKSIKLKLSSNIKEQQKIGTFFSKLDQQIELEEKKLALLEEQKNGYMQKIFSQELRFKDENGNEYPEWEEQKLGEVAYVTKLAGFEFTKYVKYSSSGKIPAIRGLNVKKGKFDFSDVNYIDESDFSKLIRSKLIPGDIVYTYVGTIGEAAVVPNNTNWYLAPNVSKIRTKNMLPEFLMYYITRTKYRAKEVESWVSTSSQPALSMENIRKFSIKSPSIEEQKKIVCLFKSYTQKIDKQTKKVYYINKLKQGLLQKMFM